MVVFPGIPSLVETAHAKPPEINTLVHQWAVKSATSGDGERRVGYHSTTADSIDDAGAGAGDGSSSSGSIGTDRDATARG